MSDVVIWVASRLVDALLVYWALQCYQKGKLFMAALYVIIASRRSWENKR
jgi:hypothetical protein